MLMKLTTGVKFNNQHFVLFLFEIVFRCFYVLSICVGIFWGVTNLGEKAARKMLVKLSIGWNSPTTATIISAISMEEKGKIEIMFSLTLLFA